MTSGTEATAATVKAMAEAGVAARAATANGMVEAAAVGAAETKGGKAGAEAAPKTAGGTAENGPGTTAAKAESVKYHEIDQRSLMFYRHGHKMAWTKST